MCACVHVVFAYVHVCVRAQCCVCVCGCVCVVCVYMRIHAGAWNEACTRFAYIIYAHNYQFILYCATEDAHAFIPFKDQEQMQLKIDIAMFML